MKTTGFFLLMFFLVGAVSCKKDGDAKPGEAFTKFPPPTWKVDETGRYPASMTAVVVLPASLQATAGETDQLAAFVNNECRGQGVSVNVNGGSVYFVLIRGLADERSEVIFKYYNAKSSYLYQTPPVLHFLVDDVYGTAQDPKQLALSPIK